MNDNGMKKMREADIDAHLKRAFKELADEGLPDRLTDLLAQLKSRDSGKRDTGGLTDAVDAIAPAGDRHRK